MLKPVLAASLAALLCQFSPIAAHAADAPATGGSWTPKHCGTEPPAPDIDLSTRTKYNESVDKVTAYEDKAKAYDACVMKEANEQMTTVSNNAKTQINIINQSSTAIQKKIWDRFYSYNSSFKDAEAKFEDKK